MFRNRKVLEIGSLVIKGSVRKMFDGCSYTGFDISPGLGVDVVCEGQKNGAPDATFNVVISCEVLEHNPFWREAFANMIRLLQPGGLMIMSCATRGRSEHGTSHQMSDFSPHTVDHGWDYYKNLTAKDVRTNVNLTSLCSFAFATNIAFWIIYLLGIKSKCTQEDREPIRTFQWLYRRWVRDCIKRVATTLREPSHVWRFLQPTDSNRDCWSGLLWLNFSSFSSIVAAQP